ncbi:MAG: YihY/virulence factor BrkB family protein [Acidobacteria bacterium]|nr:YihY/virulence factor BrkB family protein [Acidobacteriota bacterium]
MQAVGERPEGGISDRGIHRLAPSLRLPFFLVRQSCRNFMSDRCFDHAVLIAFYAIFSFVPLLIVLITAANKFLGSMEAAYEGTLGYTRDFVIQTDPTFIFNAQSFLQSMGRYRIPGLVLSLIIATAVFSKIEAAMNHIMKVNKRKPFILRKLLEITLILGGSLFLILSFVLTSVATAVEGFLDYHLASAPMLVPPHWMEQVQGFLLGILLPYLFSVVFFAAIYKFVPNRYVPSRVALTAAVVTSILWESAKRVFTWYVSNLALYGRMYGQLESFIVFAIWVDLSSIILLWGAEFAYALNHVVLPFKSLQDA